MTSGNTDGLQYYRDDDCFLSDHDHGACRGYRCAVSNSDGVCYSGHGTLSDGDAVCCDAYDGPPQMSTRASGVVCACCCVSSHSLSRWSGAYQTCYSHQKLTCCRGSAWTTSPHHLSAAFHLYVGLCRRRYFFQLTLVLPQFPICACP